MDITCRKCGQQYHIPDRDVDDRRVYFNCEGCGEKIVIDRTREGRQTPVSHPVTGGAGELLSGVRLSFSWQRVLIAFTSLFLMTCVALLTVLLFLRKGAYFADHPAAAILIAGLVLILCLCLYDLQGFFVSRSTLLSLDSEGKTPPLKTVLQGEAPGLNLILLFTVTIPLVTLVMYMPVKALKAEYSFHYAGIVLPFSAVMLFVFLLYRFFREIIIARLARPEVNAIGKGWYVVIGLFKGENINLVAYSAFINCISWILFISAILAAALALVIPLGLALVMTAGNIMASAGNLMSGAGMTLLQGAGAGVIIVAAGSSLFILLIFSWLVVLRQSLATVAVRSMLKDPGNSLSPAAVLIGCLLTMLPLILMLLRR